MTVKDLITLLQGYDPTMRVIVSGYEGGYDDVNTVEPLTIALDVNKPWYYGPHDVVDEYRKHQGAISEIAMYIGRQ